MRTSIGLILDKIIHRHDVCAILNGINTCRKLSFARFKLILFHEALTVKQIKKFIADNKDILFEVNTDITKIYNKRIYYFIDDRVNSRITNYKYKYVGGVLAGINEYIKIMKHVKLRKHEKRR